MVQQSLFCDIAQEKTIRLDKSSKRKEILDNLIRGVRLLYGAVCLGTMLQENDLVGGRIRMKLFKRLVAVVMTAVLSLSVLTACGGSGSGSGAGTASAGRLAKLTEAAKQSGEVYLELRTTDGSVGHRIAINGKYNLTISGTGKTDDTIMLSMKGRNYYYKKDGSEWIEGESDNYSTTPVIRLLGLGMTEILRVDPSYLLEGKGVFYAESFPVEILEGTGIKASEEIYCFDGDDLKYIVMGTDNGTVVAEAKLEDKIPAEMTEVVADLENFIAKSNSN